MAHPETTPHKRSCLKTILLTGIITVFLLAVTAWFARGWITAKAEAALRSELRKHELHVSYDSTSFSLFHGLVIKNLTLFRDPDHSQALFNLSNVAAAADLSGNLSALISTRDATLTGFTGNFEPTISKLNLRFRAGSEHLELLQLSGHFQGLELNAKGRLILEKKSTTPTPGAPIPPGAGKPSLANIDLEPLDRFIHFAGLFNSTNTPPLLTFEFDHNLPANTRASSGRLTGKNFSWRGIEIDTVDAPFLHSTNAGESFVDLANLSLSLRGRPLTLNARLDLDTTTLTIEKFSSSADLLALAAQAVPQSVPSLQKISLTTPPTLIATGTLPLKSPRDAALQITCSGENALAIDAHGKPLLLQNLAGDFTLKDGNLSTQNLTANLFGGSLKANTSLRPFDQPLTLATTTVSIDKAVISQVETVMGTRKGIHGTVSARFNGSGEPSLEGLNGTGHVRVDGAEFYSIPIYGSLAQIFGKLIPKFNHSEESALTADLELRQGTLSTQNLEIHSSGTTIQSTANVSFQRQYLTAHADARLGGNGLVGAATSLLGKALEIEAQGPFDDIQWRFNNIPGLNTFQSMGNLTGKLGDDTLSLITGSAGKIPGDAVKDGAGLLLDSAEGATNAFKGLLKGFGGKKDQ